MATTLVRPGKMMPHELKRTMEAGRPPRIIDVREPNEVAKERIPGSVNIPLGQFPQRLSEIGPDENAVILCRSGSRSAYACEIAARAGYRVRNLEGGISAWEGPVER